MWITKKEETTAFLPEQIVCGILETKQKIILKFTFYKYNAKPAIVTKKLLDPAQSFKPTCTIILGSIVQILYDNRRVWVLFKKISFIR